MANHRSAIKRIRQNEKRRAINRAGRSAMRTQIKKLRTALEAGTSEGLEELFRVTVTSIDKGRKNGLIKANTASRYKSRLSRQVNAVISPAAE